MLEKEAEMSKEIKTTKVAKAPKTVKVSTIVISVAVALGFVASFIGGVVYANHYNATVKAQAIELSKELK
jgi:hypothetical protein